MRPVAVVTGATGQGGSYLCELLLEKDYHVKCLVRRSTYPIEISNLRPHLGEVALYEGDVLDQSSIFKILSIGCIRPILSCTSLKSLAVPSRYACVFCLVQQKFAHARSIMKIGTYSKV